MLTIRRRRFSAKAQPSRQDPPVVRPRLLPYRRFLAHLPVVGLVLLAATSASATDYIWTGAVSSSWNAAGNWQGNTVPGAGANTRLIFGTAGVQRPNFTNPFNNTTLNAISFTAAGYTVGGNPLTLIGVSPTLLQTVAGTNTITSQVGWSNTLTANVQNADGNLILSGGVASSSGDLIKSGEGNLTLVSSANTTGRITINEGALAIGTDAIGIDATLSSSAISLTNQGILNISRGDTVTVTGATNIDARSLLVANGTLNTGTLTGTGTLRTDTIGKGMNNTLTLNQSGDSTFDGTIVGTGSLVKGGAGALTVKSDTTRSTVTVTQGSLAFSGGNHTSALWEVRGGAQLRFTGSADVDMGTFGQIRANAGGDVVYDNVRVSGGYLYGPGTHTVAAGGATFTGTHLFNSAKLDVNGNTSMSRVSSSGTVSVKSGARLSLDGFVNETGGKITVENNGIVNASDFVSNAIVTVNNGGLLKNTGSSALAFGGGSQTYIGSKSAPGGTLDTGGQDVNLQGGLLVNNGTMSGGGVLRVGYGSTVKGGGSFAGVTLAISDGGVFSPGNSPGLVNAGGMIWDEGGSMLWEINDATGAAGVNYDFTSLVGTLNIAAGNTPGSQFGISLASLLPTNNGGTLANFDANQNYSWTILTAGGGIIGFDPGKFYLDTVGFTNFNPGTTKERFTLAQDGNALKINYAGAGVVTVPESGTMLLMLLSGLAAGGGLILRKRMARPVTA